MAVSKSIIIQEGGVGKQLTVEKLKTNLVGGGTCLWVPESEVALTTKTITESGTYKASDDGYYGYSQVNVNIAGGGAVTGKDDDGDDVVAHVDPETGKIVEDKVPSSISVITPPTNPYGIYQNEQAISNDGMVVKSYLQTGGEYGTVPNSEITLDPTTAMYDPETDCTTGTKDGKSIDYTFGTAKIHSSNGSIQEIVSVDCSGSVIIATIPDNPQNNTYRLVPISTARINSITIHVYSEGSQGYTNTYSGVAKGATIHGTTYNWIEVPILSIDSTGTPNPSTTVRTVEDAIDVIFYGDNPPGSGQAGSRQQITVSWPRPLDGKILETTFEILVAPPIYGDSEN